MAMFILFLFQKLKYTIKFSHLHFNDKQKKYFKKLLIKTNTVSHTVFIISTEI